MALTEQQMIEASIALSREHDPARGDFKPTTPRGTSRFEMQNRGPMRPGKTYRDHRTGAWGNRFANRRVEV